MAKITIVFGLIMIIVSDIAIAMQAKQAVTWEYLKNEGPIKELGFDVDQMSSDGRTVYGWLHVMSNERGKPKPDAVYTAVILHNNGYRVKYIDKESRKKLPSGLFFWRSTSDIRESPIHPIYELNEFGAVKKGKAR